MNIEKTKYQIFPTNRHTDIDLIADNHKIHIGTESLRHVILYEYLGVEIDNQLTMKQHAKNILKIGAHKLHIVTTVPLSVSYGGAKPFGPWVRTSNFVPCG